MRLRILLALLALLLLGILGLYLLSPPRGSTDPLVEQARAMVESLSAGLDRYRKDGHPYPAAGIVADPSQNQFPHLFRALLAEPARMEVPREDVVVPDAASRWYRKATDEELRNPAIPKYLLDPWGNPYVYRLNAGRLPDPTRMQNPEGADIYSIGPNGADETFPVSPGADDIGNW